MITIQCPMNIGRSPGSVKYQISTGKWKMGLLAYFTIYRPYKARSLFNLNHHWNLAPARRNALDADDRSVNYQQRMVEVVHRGADVSRNKIEIIAHRRNLDAFRRVDRQMLFARFLRLQIRVAEHDASGHARVGGDSLVTSVAGDSIRRRAAGDR